MTPEEQKEHKRKLALRARKLRALGKPQRVYPHERDEAMAIIRRAHESGMSLTQMGYQLELCKTTVAQLLNGKHKTMHRETYNKILRLQPELPERSGRTRRGGAKVSPLPTVRRLQALMAMGWPMKTAAPIIGIDQRNLSKILLGKVSFVYAVMAADVAAAYDKLVSMDPAEFREPWTITTIKRIAARRRYAPPGAWDEDTIDDPDALPEWTGACGTAEGYRIHIRETIFEGNYLPLCDRCRAAVETRPPGDVPTVILNREFLITALKESPKPVKAIAREVLGDGANARDTLYRWRDGSRNPRSVGVVQRLADALDVPVSSLLDEEAMQEEAARPVVGHGEFNPYVLRAAMEMSGTSQRKLADCPGSQATQNTIAVWMRGVMKPASKDKIKPIAKYFGVDVEVFYQ